MTFKSADKFGKLPAHMSASYLSELTDPELIHACSMYAGGDEKVHELCDRLTLANMRLTQIETLNSEIYGVLKCVKP